MEKAGKNQDDHDPFRPVNSLDSRAPTVLIPAGTPTLLTPPLPAPVPHRHSAPSIFRGGWRRRSSSSYKQRNVVPLLEDTKGPLGLNLLHEPSEPWVDFIFVHGLHGGSRKTWSIDPADSSTFWPEQWLPYETGFKHVRIHSFGYDSDWSKFHHSSLRIRDFAQALLANISNSQTFKNAGDTPIVFIAHSMGGLMVKQAYLLARQDPLYQDIAARVHSMYFLATPHRGADSIAFVRTYLSLSQPTGAKSYINELLPDSQTVQDINEDFKHVCGNLRLWSFFEVVPTAGVMIVKKASAVLGLPGEHTQYLQADHRHVCKFQSVTDPNYIILCECFKTTIEQIEKNCLGRQHEQMRHIADALDIVHQPADDLLIVKEKRHHGTCQWITTHPGFQAWLNFGAARGGFAEIGPLVEQPLEDHRFLWLFGLPGSGKSVAAGSVIDYLSDYNLDCSYFFFKNDTKATITHLLLSLAFQMAQSSYEIRQTILDLLRNGEQVNTQDHTVIWNTLFLGRLFKTAFSQPQYWVIDGLDECPKKSLKSLLQKFSKIDSTVPIRIFFTSRPDSPEAPIKQLLDEEKIGRIELQTGQGDSMRDIEAYIRSRPRLSKLLNDAGNDSIIISDILEKTKGIFLWASLTTARLDELYSIEDIKSAVQEVPSEMNGFYTRILLSITESPNADKAKCILKWVVCAPEPLTREEIIEAVRLDIGHTLLAPASSDIFSEICGSLVTCDKDNGSRVQLMHQTVKEFLTSSASNFYVNRHEAHEQIASLCLSHLSGRTGLRRGARRQGAAPGRTSNSVFVEYASFNFSYHLSHSHSTDSRLFSNLVQFINTKSLMWMETVARNGNLGSFIKTIRNLKPYLARQLDKNPPFDTNYQAVSSWINDITRLVTIFGRVLIESPESVYAFIPPLCPQSSLIHRNFASSCPQKIICCFNKNWEERLSCLVFQAQVKSVASTDQYMAVGLANGIVRIFNSTTLEETCSLDHGQPVRKVAFGNLSNVLASLSPKLLTIWDSRQNHLWSVTISSFASSVAFSDNDCKVLVTLKGDVNHIMLAFSAKDGAPLSPLSVTSNSSDSDSDHNHRKQHRHCPEVVALSTVLRLAATTYRSSHLTVFSLSDEANPEKICQIVKKGFEASVLPTQVLDAVFNPVMDSDLMAVAYHDGEIVTYQIYEWNPQPIAKYHLQSRVLASSADGRTLAAGDTEGGISLFVFDTLRLMHRISPLDEAVSGIFFASSNLRLYDIRGRSCNIWEPPVLVRKSSAEDSSSDFEELFSNEQSEAVVPSRPTMGMFDDDRTITVMAPAGDERFLFCGRENGSVSIHDAGDGNQVFELGLHAVDIRHLQWQPRNGLLVSVDTSRRCVGTRLAPPTTGTSGWRRLEQVFSFRAAAAVTQILLRPDGLAVLISMERGEEVWQDGKVVPSKHSMGKSRWLLHPTDESRLLLFGNDKIHLYRWAGLEKETCPIGVSLVLPAQITHLVHQPLKNDWVPKAETGVLVQAVQFEKQSTVGFLTLNVEYLQPTTTQVVISCTTRKLLHGIKEILAVSRSHIFFSGRAGWICSLSMKSIADTQFYSRHFFIPPFWRTGTESLTRILSRNSLAIGYRDDIVIVQGFMDFAHRVKFEDVVGVGNSLAYRRRRERSNT